MRYPTCPICGTDPRIPDWHYAQVGEWHVFDCPECKAVGAFAVREIDECDGEECWTEIHAECELAGSCARCGVTHSEAWHSGQVNGACVDVEICDGCFSSLEALAKSLYELDREALQ